MKAPLPAIFVSPITHGVLEASPGNWICKKTGAKFPLIDGIPWLTPDPQRALADWQNRAEGLVQHFVETVGQMKEELDAPKLQDLTKQRLKKTRQLTIRHLEFLKDVLGPLKLKGKLNSAQATAFGYRLPAGQGLLGYFENLIRDWSLKTGENEAQLKVVESCLEAGASLGRMLVLGAGGCRLSYDLHQTGLPHETICLDINPVLLLTARRVLDQEPVTLVEFPNAPKSLEAFAETRECKAPAPAKPGLSLIFGDCYHLPFADESIDTVLTPWLIDILPRPLEVLSAEINRVLKPGGLWLNTGSLNFQLKARAKCYSIEETRGVIESSGFKIEALKQDDIPYLRSDLSGHARTETVTTFRARKTANVSLAVGPDPRPEWLRDPGLAIPDTQILQASKVVFEVQAFVLSLVDGKRSIEQLAQAVSQRYGLPPENALEAVTNFFARNYEDSIFNR